MGKIIQTREEYYKEQVANGGLLCEILYPGDSLGLDAAGTPIFASKEAANAYDIRAIDPETGKHTGWNKADKLAEVEAAWEALNA